MLRMSYKFPRSLDVSFLVADQRQEGHDERRFKKGPMNDRISPIFFAVAGSGKTQSIFDFRAAKWGHYLVSGHIQDSQANQDSTLSPHRGGASADTQWLFQLFERLYRRQISWSDGREVHEILMNRQMLMETRAKSSDMGPSCADSKHWLLFRTACTPLFDPFKETLKLRILVYCSRMDYEPPKEVQAPLKNVPTITDEAQNELDPVWNDPKIPLARFIEAVKALGHVVSISGNSLRMKDCRKAFFGSALSVPLPQHSKARIGSLLSLFRLLSHKSELFKCTINLTRRVAEHYSTRQDEQELIEFLGGTDLKNIVGDFYFTEAFKKADQSTRKLLEDSRTFLIPRLGFFAGKITTILQV